MLFWFASELNGVRGEQGIYAAIASDVLAVTAPADPASQWFCGDAVSHIAAKTTTGSLIQIHGNSQWAG
ncbi:hypothetical protein WKW77_29635 [Variovorax ureilyticus]|uniref:Uncharacterized protein n=1 Tax=Variovorax ureilyticus TaxID=1836198 RepID=A0ABU8VP21_9BURK